LTSINRRENKMIGHIDIGQKRLFAMTPGGTQVMAAASENFRGEFRWISRFWGRSGRKDFSTVEKALTAAAKSLGVTVCDIRN